MPSAGELLRCERLKRNRSLSEIARETCISTRYLEAIEADNPEILPGHFFHRSFIRQYAGILGLQEAETRKILDTIGPPPDIDLIPVFSIPQKIAQVEQSSRPLAHIPTRVAAILLFVVLVGCSGLYAVWNRAQEAADPEMHVVVPPANEPVVSAPVPHASAPSRLTEQVAVSDPGQMNVNLAATEKTWVSLSSAEGKTLYSGVLDPSEPKHFALPERARLLTSNAAGVDVSINGRAVGPLGPRGQVRLVLLSQDNFQILSPRKM
jgi:cytoskeleton protein RodZ